MEREPKKERGGRGRVTKDSSPPPPRTFTPIFLTRSCDSRSSFFAPKPHGNACYAGYVLVGIIGGGYVSKGDNKTGSLFLDFKNTENSVT